MWGVAEVSSGMGRGRVWNEVEETLCGEIIVSIVVCLWEMSSVRVEVVSIVVCLWEMSSVRVEVVSIVVCLWEMSSVRVEIVSIVVCSVYISSGVNTRFLNCHLLVVSAVVYE